MKHLISRAFGFIQLLYESLKGIATEKQDGIARETIVINGKEVRI